MRPMYMESQAKKSMVICEQGSVRKNPNTLKKQNMQCMLYMMTYAI